MKCREQLQQEIKQIDNVVDFSAWLQERDVKPIDEANDWSWLDRLVTEYDEEQEDE